MAAKVRQRTKQTIIEGSVPNANGCWIWPTFGANGYGKIGVNKRAVAAHRFSWELFRGPIPARMEVCHRCDEPRCVNPDHLWIGTHAENMRDMKEKVRARSPKGTDAKGAKVTPEIVRAIRADPRIGRVIGEQYGIAECTVYNIKTRATWRHVD